MGCAGFKVTGMMCSQLRADPYSTVPSECRMYSEDEATKASRIDKEILSPSDAIKFTKDK